MFYRIFHKMENFSLELKMELRAVPATEGKKPPPNSDSLSMYI
jgi:hypothetical protein